MGARPLRAIKAKNPKTRKARMRGGVQGGPGVPGGVQAGLAKNTNCMASLLRSNIQDFVQEVPVHQMAQGTPFRCLDPPPYQGRKGGG